MNNVLRNIIDAKREELRGVKAAKPIEALLDTPAYHEPARSFIASILAAERPAFVTELKKASPSAGLLSKDFSLGALTAAYVEAGASAISVLTEKNYFLGALENLKIVRGLCELPLLRKDFLFEEYQVHEARAAGADAMLLIVAALEQPLLEDLAALARSIGLETLVEAHDGAELERALSCGADVVGVNNRNLRTLIVDIETSIGLAGQFPQGVCRISESGISSREDVERLVEAGYHGILVGQSLVTAEDPGAEMRKLLGRV